MLVSLPDRISSSIADLEWSQNYLEFSLRLQEYIELCRKRDTAAALVYLRKYLAQWKDTHLKEIPQASVLLAYDENTDVPSYRVRSICSRPIIYERSQTRS